ncbi:MAG: hypothetical protein JKX94_08715, partial [Sneathiella sp.]|nr:hypothetical protein [Sneathiella sp.]
MTKDSKFDFSRRGILKAGAATGLVASTPAFFMSNAWAEEFVNNPGNAAEVKLGFNVPQSGPYSEEGKDELRAYKLAVKHLNGDGDGG